MDPILGPEMRSTGEVMGAGRTFGEAMLKSQLGAGSRLPRQGTVVITVKNSDKQRAVAVAADLVALGFRLVATKGSSSTRRWTKRGRQSLTPATSARLRWPIG